MNNEKQPAFPTIESINHYGIMEVKTCETGLTKREYFAAMAMQGMLANIYSKMSGYEMELPDIAHDAAKAADDLLKQLSNETNS